MLDLSFLVFVGIRTSIVSIFTFIWPELALSFRKKDIRTVLGTTIISTNILGIQIPFKNAHTFSYFFNNHTIMHYNFTRMVTVTVNL